MILTRRTMVSWLAIGLLSFGSAVGGWAKNPETYVPFRPDLAAGTPYTIEANQLHPTQFTLGWREVVYKAALLDGKSPAAAVAYLQKKDVPIVIGPGGVPYLTDGHHTLRGLLAAKRADKTAYGHVLANWSELAPAEFWKRMVASNYVYLRDATGATRAAAELPVTLEAMARDPYRSLTWALKEAGAFTELKDVYFQEFFWGDFLRDQVTWDDADEADFARAVAEATRWAHSPEAQHLPGAKPE